MSIYTNKPKNPCPKHGNRTVSFYNETCPSCNAKNGCNVKAWAFEAINRINKEHKDKFGVNA